MTPPLRGLLAALLLPPLAPLSAQEKRPPADPQDDGIIITRPQRTLEDIEKTYKAMQPVKYTPPDDRWAHLPLTTKVFKEGGELRVVMLGDSIVNDTSRSEWDLLLHEKVYPNVVVKKTTSVRGSAGCWWFKEPGRVKKYVLDFNPHLVMIGGISQHDDTDSIRDVIKQIRAAIKPDILLMTGPFGKLDPNDEDQWKKLLDPPPGDYRNRLPAVAKELGCEYLDMQKAWGEAVRATGQPVTAFKRDAIHGNAQGEQIVGRILVAYFSPKEKK